MEVTGSLYQKWYGDLFWQNSSFSCGISRLLMRCIFLFYWLRKNVIMIPCSLRSFYENADIGSYAAAFRKRTIRFPENIIMCFLREPEQASVIE